MNSTQRTLLSRLSAAVLVSTFSLNFSALCWAGGSPSTELESLKYSDLNLSKAADASELYIRIKIAAQEVCRRFEDRDLQSQNYFHQCVHQAIVDAVTTIDRPTLYAAYNARNPNSKQVRLAGGPTG
jgi:UrcA family protein